MASIIDWFVNLLTGKKKQTKAPEPKVKLLFLETFNRLYLSSGSYIGVWRPNDNWQNVDGPGYEDFAGESFNLNPNEKGSPNPFAIDNDGLIISCTKRNNRWEGGILITDSRKQSFKYGYISARIKFDNIGPGMFPAFWLYSIYDNIVPLAKAGAELDVMEVIGDGKTVTSSAHMLNNDQEGISAGTLAQSTVKLTEWNTYAVDWQPTHIVFYINDKKVGELPKKHVGFFNVPMAIRLNYSMDASWFPIKSDETTPSPLLMRVSEVRVTDKKP